MKYLLLFICLFCYKISSFGQNVSILPTGITPAPAAAYPRLSYTQIQSLASPQQGDLAYDLTFMCLRVYSGTKWLKLLTAQANDPSSVATLQELPNSTVVSNIKKDQAGNLYVAGYFNGTVNFGSGTITAVNDKDVFVAKYSPTGTFTWVRVGASLAGDVIYDMEIDVNNNIIIYGNYFDNITFGNITLPYTSGFNGFLVKYDTNGNVSWAKKILNSGFPGKLETDMLGNIYTTGYITGSNTFQSSPSNVTFTSNGTSDGFVCKLDANGVVSWVSMLTGPLSQIGGDVKITGTDVYVVAQIEGSTNVGLANPLTTNANSKDVAVLKYNTNGLILNATTFGNANTDEVAGLFLDGSSGVYVYGQAYGDITIGGVNFISSGGYDGYFVKFNAALTVLNAALIGGPGSENVFDLCTDNVGNIYCTGSFTNSISNGLKTVNSFGQSDVFVSKYSSNFTPVWIQNYGGTGSDVPKTIEFLGGFILVNGTFQGAGYFGNTLISTTNTNIFKLKIVD